MADYDKQLKIVGALALLFCAAGVVLCVLGIMKYTESRSFAKRAKSADGKVLGFERWDAPGSDARDDVHYAIVVYEADDGREVRFQGPSKDGPVEMQKGDKVRVLYNPKDPTDARVDCFMGMWFAATMLCGLGAAAIILPLLTLWQGWKWVKQQEGAAGG